MQMDDMGDYMYDLISQHRNIDEFEQIDIQWARTEDLIEKIWNQKYEHTMDAKLYKLIQRIRDQDTFEIVTQNQCYHLRKVV